MQIVCIIPARYASQRLPGKPLQLIGDTPMIGWVYKRAKRVSLFASVIVATDDQRIYDYICSIDGEAKLTPSDLPSGTDRVAHLARDLSAEVIVNLQGDEPLITPHVLAAVCNIFNDKEVKMATPISIVKNPDELKDPNLVRVVIDSNRDALYFTRSVIPFIRDDLNMNDWLERHTFYKHIGIYAYRNEFLQKLTTLPPGQLESAEKLEQLRVLENGYKIRTVLTDYHSLSVDTEEDLYQLNQYVIEKKLTADDDNG